MLHADLLCGPQWPCMWAPFKASALPTKMEHSFSCKRTEKKTEEENWPTNMGESPALTTHPTILSKPSAVCFFPGNLCMTNWISQSMFYKPPYQYNWPWLGSFSNSSKEVPLTAETNEKVPLGSLGVAKRGHKRKTRLRFSKWHILCGTGVRQLVDRATE